MPEILNYYKLDKHKIYVFVDDPPYNPDHKQKEDKQKRDNLESKGYSVVELDFIDGKYKKDFSLIEEEINAKLKPYLI